MNTRNQIASNRQSNVHGSPDKNNSSKGYSTDAHGHRVNKIKIKYPKKKNKKSKHKKKSLRFKIYFFNI